MKYLFIISLFLFSCHEEKLILHKWDTYVIKEGEQESGTHMLSFNKSTLEFDAIFDSSAIYRTSDPVNQTDVNKLFGFSDCNSGHQENSARFGWSWNDSLNIYAYCYSEGKAKHKYITSVKVGTVNRYMIRIEKNKYRFLLAGKEVEMERGCTEGFKYLLFPYFGGSEKSPQKITIKLKYLS
jgi:hypothetical protein